MKDDDRTSLWFGLFVGSVLGVAVGAMATTAANGPREQEAIERGFAIYHPQTGEFTWREGGR